MTFDFHVADNAIPPHIKIYVADSERTICIIPIENGDIAEAESLATVFIEALTADPRSGGL